LTPESLYVAIAMLGATVMPHNLYLHSALVQTRRIGRTTEDKRRACRYNLLDSTIALNGALLVNAAILILAATVFYKNGVVVTEIQQAHQLLAPLLGTTLASIAFGVALLLSGQSSTMTGTMAGQIVMEGFLHIRMRPWLRRLITRLVAITPAAIAISASGDEAVLPLLILSQVVLSMQLPFAVIPLLHFTSDRQRMGTFANSAWVRILAWLAAGIIVALNVRLVMIEVADWYAAAGPWRPLLIAVLAIVFAGLALLLAWISAEPLVTKWIQRFGRASIGLPRPVEAKLPAPMYQRILVPLDHSPLDRVAIAHAAALARLHGGKLYLFHVEEGVTSQIYGSLSHTAEVEAGQRYLDEIVGALKAGSIEVEAEVCHSRDPGKEIVQYARKVQPDLLVMGAHGHRTLKDIIFGRTIDPVRHSLNVPILVVREG
jgi:manganese transport protein